MNTNKKMMNSNKKISSNLQFSEIESLIKKYKLETVNINIKFEDNSLEKPTKPLVVENIDIPANKNSKINIFELTFFTPLATPDSKYFKNIKINNSINIFRFKGSTSPFKEEIFEIEFKSPSNIYDKQGKLILDSLNFDKRDSDIKEFFNYLVREKYENVHHLKGNESESISLGFDETSKINFILIENVNSKIINLTSKLPITVVAFNSNFKLEYKYQKIQNEPLIKIEKSNWSSAFGSYIAYSPGVSFDSLPPLCFTYINEFVLTNVSSKSNTLNFLPEGNSSSLIVLKALANGLEYTFPNSTLNPFHIFDMKLLTI